MTTLSHLLLFFLSASVIWFFAGLLIDSIDRVAKRFHQSGFTVAFFVLGFLTSISEISVMVNSTLNKIPEVSAGNLSGASLVILLFIVPFLAVSGGGVALRNTLTKKQLALALFFVLLPTVFLLDGNASFLEGFLCLAAYGVLLYIISKPKAKTAVEVVEEVEGVLVDNRRTDTRDIVKILSGGILIFLAGNLLVRETEYLAAAWSVPASIIGLLILSLGTNVPELVIAFRSILKKHKDIAFGDYIGSAMANTAIFGFLVTINRGLSVEAGEFFFTAILMVVGFGIFYRFAVSKNRISRQEGGYLLVLYGVFVLVQCLTMIKFAND